MSTDVTSIRLPKKDSIQIDHFIEVGQFKSKSEFIRYAVKKTINEMILREIQEKIGSDEQVSEGTLNEVLKEVKDIRKRLWDQYVENLS